MIKICEVIEVQVQSQKGGKLNLNRIRDSLLVAQHAEFVYQLILSKI